jgi:hypothetical protein
MLMRTNGEEGFKRMMLKASKVYRKKFSVLFDPVGIVDFYRVGVFYKP